MSTNLFAALHRVRLVLGAGVVLRAIGWGAFTALTLLLAAGAADYVTPLAVSTRLMLLGIAAIAGAAIAATLLWRDRAVLSTQRVALWIEERQPTLRYALVAACTTGDVTLARGVRTTSWIGLAVQRSIRAAAVPAAALVAAVVIIAVLPSGAVARLSDPHAGDALDRAANRPSSASRLSPLVVHITPPAYTGDAESSLDEPSEVRALTGSVVRLEGAGAADGIQAVSASDTVSAHANGDRWTIELHVAGAPVAVRLIDRNFQRIVAIEPIADAPPALTLTSPAHDTVLRRPRGVIRLAAEATDDHAIASAAFEYVVSSGEGENFTFKSGTLGTVQPRAPRATLAATLNLETLGLKPGDIVHVRAIARDANDVTGPGTASSDTRSIRIARPDEFDSVAVDAAAPAEADKTAISQRMLINLADALEKRRPSIARDTLVRESRAIAADQRRLRSAVSQIVFGTSDTASAATTSPIDVEDEGDPVLAVNKTLLEAYNAMWDASTALETGEPGKALPPMRRALAALQRARQAERIYLRGRPPQVVLDLSRVRLKGKDKGASSTRAPLEAIDRSSRAFADRFVRILDVAERDPSAAADSLLMLRIDALDRNPAFANALGESAEAIRRGRSEDASNALVRARRALGGGIIARDSIARWGLVP